MSNIPTPKPGEKLYRHKTKTVNGKPLYSTMLPTVFKNLPPILTGIEEVKSVPNGGWEEVPDGALNEPNAAAEAARFKAEKEAKAKAEAEKKAAEEAKKKAEEEAAKKAEEEAKSKIEAEKSSKPGDKAKTGK